MPDYEIRLVFMEELFDATVRGCRLVWGRVALRGVGLVGPLGGRDLV